MSLDPAYRPDRGEWQVDLKTIKNLPVVQCANCPEYLIEDGVLGRVDEILARVDTGAELEIIRYAA